MRRPLALLLTLVLALVLGACADGEVAAGDLENSFEAAPGAVDDAPGGTEDMPVETGSGIVVQFRGDELTAGQDSMAWSCSTSDDGGFAAVMFLDGDGNDVSINHDGNAETTAALTLADGTTWNVTDDGSVDVSRQADGAYDMRIELTDVDTGETASMDAVLRCG